MKAKMMIYLFVAGFILSLASCSKEEPDDKKQDCGCEQEQKTAPERPSGNPLGISDSK